MDPDLLKLLGSGGFAATLVGLFYLIGMRIVRALDRLGTKMEEHTTTDLAHHARVHEKLVELETKVDVALDARWDELTPVGRTPKPRVETSPRGVPITEYRQTRRRTEDDR